MDIANCAEILRMTHIPEARSLCKLVAKFIGKNLGEVRKTEGWLDIPPDLNQFLLDNM